MQAAKDGEALVTALHAKLANAAPSGMLSRSAFRVVLPCWSAARAKQTLLRKKVLQKAVQEVAGGYSENNILQYQGLFRSGEGNLRSCVAPKNPHFAVVLHGHPNCIGSAKDPEYDHTSALSIP